MVYKKVSNYKAKLNTNEMIKEYIPVTFDDLHFSLL